MIIEVEYTTGRGGTRGGMTVGHIERSESWGEVEGDSPTHQ
jgi:hypothetical protein